MGNVDVDDDDIRRFVVLVYAYDPERRDRRHQVVAAFDKRREFERFIEALSRDLQSRRAAGEEVDPREHYSGVVREAGHGKKQRDARLLRRAVEHGVWPKEASLRRLELPASVAVLEGGAPPFRP